MCEVYVFGAQMLGFDPNAPLRHVLRMLPVWVYSCWLGLLDHRWICYWVSSCLQVLEKTHEGGMESLDHYLVLQEQLQGRMFVEDHTVVDHTVVAVVGHKRVEEHMDCTVEAVHSLHTDLDTDHCIDLDIDLVEVRGYPTGPLE